MKITIPTNQMIKEALPDWDTVCEWVNNTMIVGMCILIGGSILFLVIVFGFLFLQLMSAAPLIGILVIVLCLIAGGVGAYLTKRGWTG